jgi:hypothetical protein
MMIKTLCILAVALALSGCVVRGGFGAGYGGGGYHDGGGGGHHDNGGGHWH